MEKITNRDLLAGLINREEFIQALEKCIERCQRYGDNTALLFLDADRAPPDPHDKSCDDALNETHRLAAILQDNIRSRDLAAKIGHNNFALLLDNLDADQVEAKILALMERFDAAYLDSEDGSDKPAMSIGYNFIGPADSVTTLMSRTDEAVYRSEK